MVQSNCKPRSGQGIAESQDRILNRATSYTNGLAGSQNGGIQIRLALEWPTKPKSTGLNDGNTRCLDGHIGNLVSFRECGAPSR